MQHLEPVGYWHQAHSFVRGNWRNEAGSSPMLLAKSCHDLDWIRYIMEQPCEAVSSFGELTHFRAESAPPGAGWRCLDCAIERECAYSALKIYMERVRAGDLDWPVNVLVEDPDEERVMDALRTGPYGRCVYACDNDVVDHQVVNMRFKGGATASFTMTAFTEARPRETRIFGTAGELFGDGRRCEVFDFMRDERREYDSVDSDGMISTGHGGGDEGIMHAFLQAVAEGDPSLLRSGWKETLESHTMVFAAERARREDRVVQIADYPAV
jgi:predicted dehydrogenase